jgi:hypothetical protein
MASPTPDQTTEATETDEIITSPPSIDLADAALVTFDLKSRLECLVHDLRRFKNDSKAMSRVEKANMYPFCFGPPYFSTAMGETLLDLKLSNGYTVRQDLGRIALGKGHELCTSHTLAPALIAMFQIDLGFDEKRSFKDYYSQFCASARNSGNEVPRAQSRRSENTPASGEKKTKKNRKA